MAARNISLYIPELFGQTLTLQQPSWFDLAKGGFAVPVLEDFLSCASRHVSAVDSLTQLCELFGLHDASENFPIAAITRMVDAGSTENGYWLRADPVHVKPDRDRIVMFGNQALLISADEASQIVAEFNALYKDDGLLLHAPTTSRWYLQLDKDPNLQTVPLSKVIGQDIHPCLPSGNDAMSWHRFMNEVQMMLHGSRVNELRRQTGQPEINSLWLWGGGELPALAKSNWHKLWSNEVVSKGLGQASDTPQATLPATAEEWLEQANMPGEHLVVIDALADAVDSKDVTGWCRMLQSIEDDWVQSLLPALKVGSLNKLTILTNGAEYSANTNTRRRWWKRSKYFNQFV